MCSICQAVYVPSRAHLRLARASQAAIESAFVSICHFCFRCRRPACPSCWDEVHGICGACTLETKLPFRRSTPSLDGSLPSSSNPDRRFNTCFNTCFNIHLPRVHVVAPPLVCMQGGRFQREPLPIETQTTLSMVMVRAISDEIVYDPTRRTSLRNIPVSSSLPSSAFRIDVVKDWQVSPERQKEQKRRRVPVATSAVDIAAVATWPEKGHHHSRAKRRGREREESTWLDRLLSMVIAILLILVVFLFLMITSALVFPSFNTMVIYFLHVDIRAEIAYLLQMIQRLF
jgi:hypothetical protein